MHQAVEFRLRLASGPQELPAHLVFEGGELPARAPGIDPGTGDGGEQAGPGALALLEEAGRGLAGSPGLLPGQPQALPVALGGAVIGPVGFGLAATRGGKAVLGLLQQRGRSLDGPWSRVLGRGRGAGGGWRGRGRDRGRVRRGRGASGGAASSAWRYLRISR